MSALLGFAAIVVLVLLNGCFVATEFALVTLRWTRLEDLVARGAPGARAAQAATARLADMIAATQLGITLCSLGVGWLGEPALAHTLLPLLSALPGPWAHVVAHAASLGLAFLAITYLHVVLGELAPKAIALQRAENVALLLAAPLLAFERVFRPLTGLMRRSGTLVVRALRLPTPSLEQSVHSAEEIDRLVEKGEQAGVIPEQEAGIVRKVFDLSDKTVRDVMVPRERVVSISIGATEDEILDTAREYAHTRMPVWDGEPDNVVGIVNTKDLFHIFSIEHLVILADAMYPVPFVTPEQPVGRVLARLRKEKRHMAVVKGPDGRFVGVVTIEDILEEIVGEIEDEHD